MDNFSQVTVCLNNAIPDASPKGTTIMYMTSLYFSDIFDEVVDEKNPFESEAGAWSGCVWVRVFLRFLLGLHVPCQGGLGNEAIQCDPSRICPDDGSLYPEAFRDVSGGRGVWF